ncbi:MAG: hypothetical protein WAW37_10145 [Syntrophobacteraceae bacterium]
MAEQKHIYSYYIDRDGNWFCEDNPVDDPALFRMLSRALYEEDGRYFLRCEGEVHPVRVADAPLWVRYVHVRLDSEGELSGVEIELRDGRGEELDAQSLHAENPRALYCAATPRRLKARFAKTAYNELTRYLKEAKGEYYLTIGGRKFVVWTEGDSISQ